MPPLAAMQTPRDLDRRRERSVELHMRQSDRADEWRDARSFDGPFAEASLGQVLFRTIDVGVAFRPRQYTRQKPHHEGIGVLLGESRTVAVPPGTKDKVGGFD